MKLVLHKNVSLNAVTQIYSQELLPLDRKLPVQFLISAVYTRCYNLIVPPACYVGITGTETEDYTTNVNFWYRDKVLDSELVPVMETRHALETLHFATTLDIMESMFHSELEGNRLRVDSVRTSICTYLQFNVFELTSRNINVVLHARYHVHFITLG